MNMILIQEGSCIALADRLNWILTRGFYRDMLNIENNYCSLDMVYSEDSKRRHSRTTNCCENLASWTDTPVKLEPWRMCLCRRLCERTSHCRCCERTPGILQPNDHRGLEASGIELPAKMLQDVKWPLKTPSEGALYTKQNPRSTRKRRKQECDHWKRKVARLDLWFCNNFTHD